MAAAVEDAAADGLAQQEQQQQQLHLQTLSELEARVAALEGEGPGVLRVRRHCVAAGVASAVFKWVPPDYYSRPMAARAGLLGCFEEQMCKALLMENLDWQPLAGVAEEDSELGRRANSRYVLVVLQYAAKMNADKLRKAMHAHCNAALEASGNNQGSASSPVPLAQFRYRLAPEEVSDALTGFTHNAVTPFGLKTEGIPVVLSEAVLSVQPHFLYMGGGHVECKLGCTLYDFVRALDPIVANVSDPR